jgi:hypothetical protein
MFVQDALLNNITKQMLLESCLSKHNDLFSTTELFEYTCSSIGLIEHPLTEK